MRQREDALARITDQTILAKILKATKDEAFQKAVLERCIDPKVLTDLISDVESYERYGRLQDLAEARLTSVLVSGEGDEDKLIQLTAHPIHSVKYAATDKLKVMLVGLHADVQILSKIAAGHPVSMVAYAAAEKLLTIALAEDGSATHLSELASGHEVPRVRIAAIGRSKDRIVLNSIAQKDADEWVRRIAKERLIACTPENIARAEVIFVEEYIDAFSRYFNTLNDARVDSFLSLNSILGRKPKEISGRDLAGIQELAVRRAISKASMETRVEAADLDEIRKIMVDAGKSAPDVAAAGNWKTKASGQSCSGDEFVMKAVIGPARCDVPIREIPLVAAALVQALGNAGVSSSHLSALFSSGLLGVCPKCNTWCAGPALLALGWLPGTDHVVFTGNSGGADRLLDGKCRNAECDCGNMLLFWCPDLAPGMLAELGSRNIRIDALAQKERDAYWRPKAPR